MPLRAISPRIPTELYQRAQDYRIPRGLSQRALVELALQRALDADLQIPILQPESQTDTTSLGARIDSELYRRAKQACVIQDRRLRALLAAALTAYLS